MFGHSNTLHGRFQCCWQPILRFSFSSIDLVRKQQCRSPLVWSATWTCSAWDRGDATLSTRWEVLSSGPDPVPGRHGVAPFSCPMETTHVTDESLRTSHAKGKGSMPHADQPTTIARGRWWNNACRASWTQQREKWKA